MPDPEVVLPVEQLIQQGGVPLEMLRSRLAEGATRASATLAGTTDVASRDRLTLLESAYRAGLALLDPLHDTLRRRDRI